MNSPEIIKTKRLLLEPFSEKHLTKVYVGWLNDLEVVRFSEQRHRKHTLESCRKYIDSYIGTQNRIWAICVLNDELLHIGNITAHVNTDNNIADVGILIGAKEVWGKGYGTESFVAVLNYLIENLGIRKVSAGALSTNTRMLKVMEKSRMVDDGRRSKHYIWEGQKVDMIHMAIFNE